MSSIQGAFFLLLILTIHLIKACAIVFNMKLNLLEFLTTLFFTWVSYLSFLLVFFTWVSYLSFLLELLIWVFYLSFLFEFFIWIFYLNLYLHLITQFLHSDVLEVIYYPIHFFFYLFVYSSFSLFTFIFMFFFIA